MGKNQMEMYASLDEYFNELKSKAVPFAMRMVCDECGMTTRDDNPDEVALPPHMTQTKCYHGWCYKCGWKVKKASSAKTIYSNPANFEVREFDKDEWPVGSVPQQICSWPTF
eukprot:15365121-Ditylum_brightwellii.AAC.1